MKKRIIFTLGLLFSLTFFGFSQDQKDFYDVNSIQELNIQFEQENWRYILDSLRYNGDEVLIGNISINGNTFNDVGIRYRASRSFQPGGRRNGLDVQLNFIKKDQNYQGYKTINLSSALRDPSMVREVLAFEVARSYMPAAKANYAKVQINEEYYGLFVNIQAVDNVFLMDHFGSSDGSFFRCDPKIAEDVADGCKPKAFGSLQYDNGAKCYLEHFEMLSRSGWDDLIELTQVLSESPDRIAEVLDVDRTLWMLAFNNVLINLNSYTGQFSQNYYLYKNSDGKFVPILWDLNLAFGSYKNLGTGSDLRTRDLIQLNPLAHSDNPAKPLLNVLLQNDRYQKMYLSHMRTILQNHFKGEKFRERATAMQETIKVPLINDRNKFYTSTDFNQSLETTIGKRSRIPGLVTFMKSRSSFLQRDDLIRVIPPEISEIEVVKRERFSAQQVKSFKVRAKVDKFPKDVYLFYRLNGQQSFMEVAMKDDGKSNDDAAGDGVFGVEIQPQNGSTSIEYFIFAENAKAVNYSPANYMYKRYTSNLTELNN